MTKPQQSKNRAEKALREAGRRAVAAEQHAAAERKRVNGYRHTLTPADADLIREIRFQLAQERVSTRNIDRAVLKLRRAGASWQQIAGALGVSRQAAMKRHAAALLRA